MDNLFADETKVDHGIMDGAESHVPTIGLIGGIASGKSYVANVLQDLGCPVIDADQLGHQVLTSPKTILQLQDRFGGEILTAAGQIDRQSLARLVFGSTAQAIENRKRLESIVHPAIKQLALEQIARLRQRSPRPRALVIDAPLLLEAGWDSFCSAILLVDTPDTVRRQRAIERGWTRQQWQDREASQLPIEKKRARATHTVSGLLPRDQLRDWTEGLLKSLAV
jgi:dephospho-CoA kinase